MEQTSKSFTGAGGVEIHTDDYLVPNAKASIVLAHGYGEHSGRYKHIIEAFNNANYNIHTIDHRGHGRSGGRKGNIDKWDNLIGDLEAYISQVFDHDKTGKVFLVGHSMGGLAALWIASLGNYPYAGVVTTGALLRISDEISPLLIKVSKILDVIAPWLPTIRVDSTAVSRDSTIVQKYENDPLVFRGKIKVRTGTEMNKAIQDIQDKFNEIKVPVLMLHGSGDRLADMKGSQEAIQKISSVDKTIRIYDGLYHELFNEPEKAEVVNCVIEWLDSH